LLVLAAVQFAVIECLLVFHSGSDQERQTEYLIILGAGLRGELPSPILNARLEAGVRYLKKYPGTVAVVSGGQGRGEAIPEAEAMRRYLISKGIEEGRILVESNSTSTMENFRFSKSLIEKTSGRELKEVTFASSDFHLLRARMIAGRNHLRAYAISCNTPASVIVQLYIREYFALFKSFAADR
jgi:uncharacterized SAM-binding protein YcdF (DUF218 family)